MPRPRFRFPDEPPYPLDWEVEYLAPGIDLVMPPRNGIWISFGPQILLSAVDQRQVYTVHLDMPVALRDMLDAQEVSVRVGGRRDS